jgi:hypothetical protein
VAVGFGSNDRARRTNGRSPDAEAVMVTFALFCVVALLVLSPIAVVLSRSPRASGVVYASCLIIALALTVVGGMSLLGQPTSSIVLPLGLPWLGAHFRVDALSAFFLIVVNLGGAAASMFALGYGQHEHAPERVLPFYPAYLAGMNVVVLADDAFSFLVAWEFMSLTSWALVVAHHRERDNLQAGYIYLLMAGFGTLALLLAFGLLAGGNGNYLFESVRADCPCLDPRRRRIQGGRCPSSRLVAARSSGCAQSCLRIDERRHDQGGDLWFCAHCVRSARSAGLVVEHARARHRRRHRSHGRALCPDAA